MRAPVARAAAPDARAAAPVARAAAPVARAAALVALLLPLSSCGGETDASGSAEAAEDPHTRIVRLLKAGQPVFGIFSGEHTAEQGGIMAQTRETDFVFYSLESGPFDLGAMEAYGAAMQVGGGDAGARPMALRIPPIRDGEDEAVQRVQAGLAAGVAGIVFPHIESAADAALAVSAMGDGLWPANPNGALVNMLIVEDQVGIGNATAIAATPGVSVVFAGPGDLRRAYEGDMDAVENAIQTVLAACKAADVACGITAGVDDIAARLEQGFRVIIVTQAEALAVGRAAAGRTD